MIKTIQELQSAKEPEIQTYVKKVTVLEDLAKFEEWLVHSRTKVDIPLKIGGEHRSLGIHPSSVSKEGFCPLKIYYECTGTVEKIEKFELDRNDTFNIGTAWHSILQAFFHKMYGDQFDSEVKLTDKELHIHSSTDGIFTFSDYRFILEIKTIKEGGSFGFEKVATAPLEEHVRQVMMYMHMSDIPFGLIFYFNKNTSVKKEYVILYSEAVWGEIENEIWPIVKAAYNGGPTVKAKPGYHCRYCGYLHGCKTGKEQDEERPRRSFR